MGCVSTTPTENEPRNNASRSRPPMQNGQRRAMSQRQSQGQRSSMPQGQRRPMSQGQQRSMSQGQGQRRSMSQRQRSLKPLRIITKRPIDLYALSGVSLKEIQSENNQPTKPQPMDKTMVNCAHCAAKVRYDDRIYHWTAGQGHPSETPKERRFYWLTSDSKLNQ